MDKRILEYQKLDTKLKKLEREISGGNGQKEVQELSGQIKQWQLKILSLEESAKKLLEELNKLLEVEKKGIALVEKYTKTDIKGMNSQELKDFEVKTSQVANHLAELDSRIMQHNLQVKKVVLDYEMYRKKILTAKQKRDEQKKSVDEISIQKAPDIAELKKQIVELEKQIDSTIIAKYKTLKQDGIFPVIVPLTNNRCGGCHMQLSASALDKINAKGILECEQCRRYIYIDKD
jgi:predicted  nucleic acid-binding Zn-ribbon protein